MQKECKKHHRTLEVLSLDEQKLLCIECILEEKKVPENTLRMNEVNEKIEEMKKGLNTIKSKEEDLNKNMKATIKKTSVSLKRTLDDLIEECIAPIYQLKKKLYREIDALEFIQEESYKKDKEIDLLTEWKNNQECLLSQWEKTAEAEAITEIINNHKNKTIEEKLKRMDSKMVEMEKEASVKFQSLESKMSLIEKYTMVPWKKLEEKICLNQYELNPQTQVQLEQKYLEQFLKEFGGINVEWKNTALKIQEVTWGAVYEEAKSTRLIKTFDCTLEKLNLACHGLSLKIFDAILLLLEQIKTLKEVDLLVKSNVFKTLFRLGNFVSKLVEIEKFKLKISSKYILGETFRKLLFGFAELPKLESLSLAVQGDLFGGSEVENSENANLGSGFKALREMNFSFIDCKIEKVEGYKWIWKSLLDIPKLQKLTLTLSGNYINGTILDHMFETLPLLNSIEHFGLFIEGFDNFPDINEMRSLGFSLCCLRSLKTLELSFFGEKSLPTTSLLGSIQDLPINLPGLQELSLDLGRCLKVNDYFVANLGDSIEAFQNLRSLTLKFKGNRISLDSIESLFKSISKVKTLGNLVLDFQGCQIRGFSRGTEDLFENFANLSLMKREIIFKGAKEDNTLDSEISSMDSGSDRTLDGDSSVRSDNTHFSDDDDDDSLYSD